MRLSFQWHLRTSLNNMNLEGDALTKLVGAITSDKDLLEKVFRRISILLDNLDESSNRFVQEHNEVLRKLYAETLAQIRTFKAVFEKEIRLTDKAVNELSRTSHQSIIVQINKIGEIHEQISSFKDYTTLLEVIVTSIQQVQDFSKSNHNYLTVICDELGRISRNRIHHHLTNILLLLILASLLAFAYLKKPPNELVDRNMVEFEKKTNLLGIYRWTLDLDGWRTDEYDLIITREQRKNDTIFFHYNLNGLNVELKNRTGFLYQSNISFDSLPYTQIYLGQLNTTDSSILAISNLPSWKISYR